MTMSWSCYGGKTIGWVSCTAQEAQTWAAAGNLVRIDLPEPAVISDTDLMHFKGADWSFWAVLVAACTLGHLLLAGIFLALRAAVM